MDYPVVFKAAVLEVLNSDLIVKEIVFEGPLKLGQVLVRVIYSGICGKQIDEVNGAHGHDNYLPHLLGHEGIGIVDDIGPGVTKVTKGSKVILHWMKGSGLNSDVPEYVDLNGNKINAGWITTFNEYSVVSENRLTPFVGDLKPEYSLLGCAIPTGLGVVFNDINIKPDQTVLLIGFGGVGNFVLQALLTKCPKNIVVADTSQEALDRSKKIAAISTYLISGAKDQMLNDMRTLNGGNLFNKTIITTGNKQAIEMGIEATSTPGETVLMGVPRHDVSINVNANSIMHKRNIVGSLGGGINPDIDLPSYFRMINAGTITTEFIINKIYKLKDINLAINEMKYGSPGRHLIAL